MHLRPNSRDPPFTPNEDAFFKQSSAANLCIPAMSICPVIHSWAMASTYSGHFGQLIDNNKTTSMLSPFCNCHMWSTVTSTLPNAKVLQQHTAVHDWCNTTVYSRSDRWVLTTPYNPAKPPTVPSQARLSSSKSLVLQAQEFTCSLNHTIQHVSIPCLPYLQWSTSGKPHDVQATTYVPCLHWRL